MSQEIKYAAMLCYLTNANHCIGNQSIHERRKGKGRGGEGGGGGGGGGGGKDCYFPLQP